MNDFLSILKQYEIFQYNFKSSFTNYHHSLLAVSFYLFWLDCWELDESSLWSRLFFNEVDHWCQDLKILTTLMFVTRTVSMLFLNFNASVSKWKKSMNSAFRVQLETKSYRFGTAWEWVNDYTFNCCLLFSYTYFLSRRPAQKTGPICYFMHFSFPPAYDKLCSQLDDFILVIFPSVLALWKWTYYTK